MPKSADAFRTISEVADWLETPAHVLRFWESKFSQVKPVKRAGGRRYYRPADMKLLGGIKKLLHDDGMTIKGVQKMLRDQGAPYVSDLSQPLGDAADDVEIETGTQNSASTAPPQAIAPPSEPEPASAAPEEPEQAMTPEQDSPAVEAPENSAQPDLFFKTSPAPQEADTPASAEEVAPLPSFLNRREDTPSAPDATQDTSEDAAPTEATPDPAPRPRQITLPDDPADDIAADQGGLGHLARLPRRLPLARAKALKPLLERLREIHQSGQDHGA